MKSLRFVALFSVVLSMSTACFALFPLDEYGPRDPAFDASNDPPKDASVDVVMEAEGPTTRIVFVTSTLKHGNPGGLGGADAICQKRALEAKLPGRYRAWISDRNES